MGKRKAVSSKRAWKEIDSTDVEEALQEESRKLLRSADPQHKRDDEIFFVDKQGSAQRPGRKDPWELKSTSIIKPNEKIPTIPQNTIRKKHKASEAGKIQRMVEKIQTSGPKPAKEKKVSAAERSFDLWDAEPQAPEKVDWPVEYRNNPLDPNAVKIPEQDTRKKRKVLSNMKPAPSKHRAVDIAEPGNSYRPRPSDHERLMGKAAAVIVADEEKEARAIERLCGKINRSVVSGPLISEEDLVDPQAGVEGEEEENLSKSEEGDASQPVEARKMTKAERNKQARLKEREKAEAEAREAKRLGKQLNRLGEINKEVKRLVKSREENQQLRQELKPEVEKHKIRRLGKEKLLPQTPEVLLPEELPKTLRTAAPKLGSAVKDRFESLQRRNMIEPRSKVKQRQNLQQRKAAKVFARAFID